MRLYSFGNMYLSSIQQGIQALHASTEIMLKYDDTIDEIDQQLMFMDWAQNHKTVQLMNGGFGRHIRELHDWFQQETDAGQCRYPFAKFHEEADALDGAITCTAIVLPERVYHLAKAVSNKWIKLDQLKCEEGMTTQQYMDRSIAMQIAESNIRASHESCINFNIELATGLLNQFDIALISKLPSYRFAS